MKWEEIDTNTARMKVHGGWLIKTELYFGRNHPGCSCSVAMIFIHDERHEWK